MVEFILNLVFWWTILVLIDVYERWQDKPIHDLKPVEYWEEK